MSVVSGACASFKKAGMIYIREDSTPSVIEWSAIDQLKKVLIPFLALEKLQASKEDSPKIMLRLQYKDFTPAAELAAENSAADLKDLKLTFLNRPTMFNVKEALLGIMARRSVISDRAMTSTPGDSTPNGTPGASGPASGSALNPNNGPASGSSGSSGASGASGASASALDFTSPNSLSDASLLKNHTLQQKFLLEDKALRDLFSLAVIHYKLSPIAFWSTRITQLRTYALTISQHRGMYNVLSTIKPVATLDNKVNVSVTRDTIQEIFETYPIVKKAFLDLVPVKFSEGEFWLRFFNSRLFRRLRGDKINNLNQKGDAVLDAYINLDLDSLLARKRQKVNAIIDVEGNENDDSQKLGNKPEYAMRFGSDDDLVSTGSAGVPTNGSGSGPGSDRDKEILVIMRNMNKLSSKVVNNTKTPMQDEVQEVSNLFQDLEELEQQEYVRLNISSSGIRSNKDAEGNGDLDGALGSGPGSASSSDLQAYFKHNIFTPTLGGHDLALVALKKDEIDQTATDITGLVKHNWRVYRIGRNAGSLAVIPKAVVDKIVNTHLTCMELLTHFWNGFLSGQKSQAVATRKVMVLLKKCQQEFELLEKQCVELVHNHTDDPKQRAKFIKEIEDCLESDKNGLAQVFRVYSKALAELPDTAGEETPRGNTPRADTPMTPV